MSFTVRVTAYPDAGQFAPGSFDHLLQTAITLPALNPTWQHTLIDAHITDDGGSADLVIVSEPQIVQDLAQTLRIVDSTPPARVRVLDQHGALLVEGSYPAPLRETQDIAIGDQHWTVTAVDWPGRHPDTGVCAGDIDWQVATAAPTDPPPTAPTAAPPP